MDNGAGWLLWIDPRRPGQEVDWTAALEEGAGLFQAKERWGGLPPAVVLANPAQAENGLRPVAAALGLRVVSDPTVTAGTFRLGLSRKRKKGKEVQYGGRSIFEMGERFYRTRRTSSGGGSFHNAGSSYDVRRQLEGIQG